MINGASASDIPKVKTFAQMRHSFASFYHGLPYTNSID
jgi:hypothetical protein